MKKKIFLNFIFLLNLIYFFNIYEIQATSISNFESPTINTYEEKILKYDLKTNTTTEVNMDELNQLLNTKNNRSIPNNTTSSYIPPLKNYSLMQNPYNLRNSFYSLINNTSIYPYSTISKITYSNGSASGAIIGKNLAITAAHAVMDDNCNCYSNWQIMPGYYNRY